MKLLGKGSRLDLHQLGARLRPGFEPSISPSLRSSDRPIDPGLSNRVVARVTRRSPAVGVVMDVEMVDPQAEQSGWFDWLQQEKSLVPEGAEDLVLTSVFVLQLNGRFLYLKGTTDLAEFNAGEKRILEALTRQGDTVFVAVGPDPAHVRLSYRMPDLENAVAFDGDGLRAVIRLWFVWATSAESTSA